VQVTAANTDDEVDGLLAAITKLAQRSLLRSTGDDRPLRAASSS
jgi:hypothetical protein